MSRELDIKVARILGWTEIEDQENGLVGFAPWQTSKFGKYDIPEFSTSWEHAGPAWEWLEKNSRRKSRLALTRDYNGKPCVAEQNCDDLISISGNSETYPEAICRAIIWIDEWNREDEILEEIAEKYGYSTQSVWYLFLRDLSFKQVNETCRLSREYGYDRPVINPKPLG